jgi:elongation of very long chain fatty acids protein 6
MPLIYGYEFSIEKPFYSIEYVDSVRNWLKSHMQSILVIPIAYVILTLTGREYMKNKPRYELKLPLILWNVVLATFSIIGAIRFLPG